MLGYRGGTRVRCGYYWSPAGWEVIPVPREGGHLPGGADHRYFRVPVGLLLLLAPVMGGVYVVFLPFIGFAMILRLAGRKTAEALRATWGDMLSALGPAWRPGEAYFAGKRAGRAEEEGVLPAGRAEEDALEALRCGIAPGPDDRE